jgi:uncharacterized membrane protein YdjX (TVP38/TMEM64 family)
VLGVAVLALVFWVGRFAAHELKAVEDWIAGLDYWGPLAFMALLIVGTSLFVPDTLFAVAGGALFGLAWGTVLTFVAASLSAVLNFWISRKLLRERVLAILAGRPKLAAIERAASRQGLRLLILLRLTPLNPATISYAVGASEIGFGAFLVGCVGLAPGLFVEVYFGYVVTHVAHLAGGAHEHSRLHLVITAVGFAMCVVLLLYVTRLAHRALKDVAEEE